MVDVSYHCENAASVWIDCGEQVVAITDDMRTIPARYEEGGSLHLEWSCDYDTHAWVLTYGSGSALELVHWSAPEGQSPSGYYNETQRSRYFTVENGGLAAHEMESTAGVSYDVRWEHDVIGETTVNVQTCRMSSDDWRGVLGANFALDAYIDYTTVNSLVKIRGDATSSQWRREDASGDWVESSGYTKAKTVNVWAMNNGAQGPMTRLESTTESQTDDHNWTRTHDGSYVRDWTYETVPIPGGTSVKYNLLADELTSHRNTQSNGTWTEKWKRDVSTSWKHDPSGSGALIFDTNTVSYSDASEGQSTHYDRTTVYTDQANVPQSVVITSSAGSVTAVWWHLPTGGWVLPTCPSYLSTAPFLISAEQEAFPDMNTTVHVPLGCAY